MEATHNNVKGSGEAGPYARYEETLTSVIAQIETLSDIFKRQELHDLLPAGSARNAVNCALWDVEAKTTGKKGLGIGGACLTYSRDHCFYYFVGHPGEDADAGPKKLFSPFTQDQTWNTRWHARLQAVRQGARWSDIIVHADEGWNAETDAELAPDLLRFEVKLVE